MVIMLPGMDNAAFHPFMGQRSPIDGGYLHEIRPGSGDQQDIHCSLLIGIKASKMRRPGLKNQSGPIIAELLCGCVTRG
jgi:hypothetical protein